KLSASWAERDRPRADESEARSGLTVLDDWRGLCVSGARIGHLRPIEDVEEFSADLKVHSLPEAEGPAEAHLFFRAALIAVVIEIDRRHSVLPGGRLRPGGRVQYECGARVEAMAIQVIEEQRHTGNPVGEGGRTRKDSAKIVIRSRRLNRKPAR